MKNTLKRAFNIREEELKPVGLLLSHSFFVGMFVAFYFSNANGNFINRFDVTALPYAYIISGIAGFIVSSIFSRLQSKILYAKLITFVLLFIFALMVLFRLSLLATGEEEVAFQVFIWFGPLLTYSELISFIIFIWIAPVLGLIALQYWGMALRLFDLRQSKRLFGIIGSGDVISSIIGFFSVPLFVKLLGGTADLLWLAAIAIGLSIIFQFMLIKHFSGQLSVTSNKKKKVKGDLGSIFKNPYFKTIFIVTIISIIAQHFVDFTYVGMVRKTFPERAQLTSFIGVFFGVIKVVELIAKTVIVGKLLNQYGLKLGLVALASLIGIFTLMAAIAGTFVGIASSLFFLPIAMNKLFDLSGRKSIEEPSFKVLYQPLDSETKMMVQTQAEGKAKQIGKMSAGLLLLILTSFEFFDVLVSVYILCGLIVVWLIMSTKLYKEYRNTVKNALITENSTPKQSPVFSNELIIGSLESNDPSILKQTIIVGNHLDIDFPTSILRKLIQHESSDIRNTIASVLAKQIHPSLKICLEEQLQKELVGTLKVTWKELIKLIDELNQIHSEQVLYFSKSMVVEERKKAALWLQFYTHPKEVSITRELISDRNIEVAEMAIKINLRLKNETIFLFITELLDDADYSQEIISTLKEAHSVLSYQKLETLFRQYEKSPLILLKIVHICGLMNTNESLSFLVTKINVPNRLLQFTIAKVLSKFSFKTDGGNRRIVEEKIKHEVEYAAWLVRSMLDLRKDKNHHEIVDALQLQYKQLEEIVFFLLSFLYDSVAVERIKENLNKGTKEGVALALEMADILFEDAIKLIVKPILERGNWEEKYSLLKSIKPEPNYKTKVRLKNILLKDFSMVTPWIKALALNGLSKVSHKLPSEILAYTHHQNILLKETALVAVHKIDPKTYTEYSKRESRRDKFTFDKVTGSLKEYPKEISILEEVQLLKSLEFFENVPEDILLEIAILTKEEIISSQKPLPSYAYSKGENIHIIIEGDGEVIFNKKTIKIKPGLFLGLTENINIENTEFKTLSTTRILYMPLSYFFELAFIYTELTEAIFKYLSLTEIQEDFSQKEVLELEEYKFDDL